MALINWSYKFLEDFFGVNLNLRCYACGQEFPNEEEFMKHEHPMKSNKGG